MRALFPNDEHLGASSKASATDAPQKGSRFKGWGPGVLGGDHKWWRLCPQGCRRVITVTVVTFGPSSVKTANSHSFGAPGVRDLCNCRCFWSRVTKLPTVTGIGPPGDLIIVSVVAFGAWSSILVARQECQGSLGWGLGGRDPRNRRRFWSLVCLLQFKLHVKCADNQGRREERSRGVESSREEKVVEEWRRTAKVEREEREREREREKKRERERGREKERKRAEQSREERRDETGEREGERERGVRDSGERSEKTETET